MSFIKKSSFFSNFITIFQGSAFSQILPLLISPIIARLYFPDDFGIFGIYILFVSIIIPISSLRFDLAILIPGGKSSAINIVFLSLICTAIVSFIVFVIILIFYNPLINILQAEKLGLWIYLIPIHIFFAGYLNVFTVWATREKWFDFIRNMKIVQSVTTITVNIVFGYLGYGFIGLILGILTGIIVTSIFYSLKIYKINYKEMTKFLAVESIKLEAKEYINFPKINLWHALLSAVSINIPILFLNQYYTSALVGYFLFTKKIVGTPISVFSSSLSIVFNQQLVSLKNKKENLINFFNDIIKNIILLTIFPMLVLLIYAPEIFNIFFSEKWTQSGEFVRYLSPWFFMILLTSPFSFIPQLFNLQKKAFVVEIISLILKVIVLWICGLLFSIDITILSFGAISFAVLNYNLFWYKNILKDNKI